MNKTITLYGELYPEYIENLEYSIKANYIRLLQEFGIEKLGWFMNIRLSHHISRWIRDISFLVLKKKHLNHKYIVEIYKNIFTGILDILKSRIKLELTEAKVTTVNKVFKKYRVKEPTSLYRKEYLRSPLWWARYIKEFLNRSAKKDGQKSLTGLLDLINSGFKMDILNEILNKPVNWGCHYRLKNAEGKWTEVQLQQAINLESQAGIVFWFMYNMFREIHDYQYINQNKTDTIKPKSFFDTNFAADIYMIFKACRMDQMKFFGAMEVLINLALISLDEPTSKDEEESLKQSAETLFDEYKSYISSQDDSMKRNFNKLLSIPVKVSFTEGLYNIVYPTGSKLEKPELPESCPQLVNEIERLGLVLYSIMSIFSNKNLKVLAFLWEFWDTKILDPLVEEKDLRLLINSELTKEVSEYTRDLLYTVEQADVNRPHWVDLFKDQKLRSYRDAIEIDKLIYILSYTQINQ